MFKVIVAGGRDFTNYDLLKNMLDKLFSQKTDIEIVSGMARGADTLAVKYASEKQCPLKKFPADWEVHGNSSGNIMLKDIGVFMHEKIETYFKEEKIPIIMRYFDPNYIIRSCPANAGDSILCDLFARYAVHAAMAGKTGLVIGYLHNKFIHVPIE